VLSVRNGAGAEVRDAKLVEILRSARTRIRSAQDSFKGKLSMCTCYAVIDEPVKKDKLWNSRKICMMILRNASIDKWLQAFSDWLISFFPRNGVISILQRHLCLWDILLWDILQWDILLRLYTSTKNLYKPLIKILRNTLSKKYVNKYF
jgi:hypothetical protein